MNNEFYVYVLKYPDGTPFYVGKGKGTRWNAHEQEAQSDRASELCINPHKINIIRKIWQNGGQVIKEKVVQKVSEEKAFEVEIELVQKYKLRKLGGLLVNLTDGGEGSSGYEYTWEQWHSLKQRAKQVGHDTKERREQKATEAYVKAYLKILKKLDKMTTKAEPEKRVIAEGYAEVMAYLARNIFKGSQREKEARKTAWHMIRKLDPLVAFSYLVSEASQIGKIEAKRQAQKIREFAVDSKLFTEDEADRIAKDKAITYTDRRNTGKYQSVTGAITQWSLDKYIQSLVKA